MSFERICEAISFDGMSVNNVATVAGIPQSSLQRFCTGQQGLQMDGLKKVCEVLGLELVRRFDADELREYLDDGWMEVRADVESEEYEPQKAEAWSEASDKLWPKYAKKNKLDANDSDEYQTWETEEYQDWSKEYDEENYSAWESVASAEWEAAERERLESCEWIVLTD